MEPPPPAPPPRSPLRPLPSTTPETTAVAVELSLAPAATDSPVISKRQHALHELLSSERAYASDLALVLEIYIPLAQGPMTIEDIRTIFGNIADLAELSDILCEALEQTIGSALVDGDATDDRIGGLFLRLAPELEAPYKQYITRHPSAIARLAALPPSPELTAYHTDTKEKASGLSHAWDLASLLIKPIQRLLKYSLLLAAIIDATAPSHPDRANLLLARTAMEEVAHAVNEGRRRAEVVKEVLSAPKRPPAVLRMKSLRAPAAAPGDDPAEPNSEVARVARMAAELARIDVFAAQLARHAQEWAKGASTTADGLLRWARAFGAAIGLTPNVRSEAFDAFITTLTEQILPSAAALMPGVATEILAPLAKLVASAQGPRQLIASMQEHQPLHHHLLTMPVSPRNRPPPALLAASTHYLALRVQLAAELPAYLTLMHQGLAALVRALAALQARYWEDVARSWAGLWDMLRVEGERNAGAAETVAVWRARWGDVDLGVQSLAITRMPRASLGQGLTPAESLARGYALDINFPSTPTTSRSSGESPTSFPYSGSPASPPSSFTYGDSPVSPRDKSNDRKSKGSSSASVHSNGSSSGRAAGVAAILGALGPAQLPPVSQVTNVSGPFPLQARAGRPRGGSDATARDGGGFPGWNERGKSPARPGTATSPKSPLRNGRNSPTPTMQTSQTARTAREDPAEFGAFVAEMGWGDYGGMVLPPRKERDEAREREKTREKESKKEREREAKEAKAREKERKKEEKKKSEKSQALKEREAARTKLALLEAAGYAAPTRSKNKSTPDLSKKDGDKRTRSKDHLERRASDLTNGLTSNTYAASSHSNGKRPSSSRGQPWGDKDPPASLTRQRSLQSTLLGDADDDGRYPEEKRRTRDSDVSRRQTWLVAPALYTCRVVHPCTPPAAVMYFGYPFFVLEEHALLGVLHEAGHPGTHPRLPLYVDEGEDCLLLCRDAAGEVGWALASFLAPIGEAD
ncbi:hypothetical protein FB45DRAFT_1052278 [Roridomyces roridus]|uniref:DH domain-containing protein n=1 Tax=Roridomyces roridus TaxID=1738132 RepID=A0AAD7G0J8_9AGAR|nr:hypothetical protein FB45DRAFT_1052278 [Roridomyces roridus]